MPSKKKKYNARFPPGRIKKIMQTDEEVGKVAQAVPIIISRTLELFVHSLLSKTVEITNSKQAKTLSPAHMKQCILSESRFDFLKDLVKNLPDATNPDDDVQSQTATHTIHVGASNHSVLTKIPAADIVSVSKDAPCVQISSRRKSFEKGDKTKLLKPVEGNETVFASNVPVPNKVSVPTSFNASQPNFYTEVNSNSSDNVPKNIIKPVSNFTCTVDIDEDYDT